MSEPMSSGEIEDVLSSIRRLVSEDLRPGASNMGAAKASETKSLPAAGKLLLTPALRVVSNNTETTSAPRPIRHDEAVPKIDPADDAQDWLPEANADPLDTDWEQADVTRVVSEIGAAVAERDEEWEPEIGDASMGTFSWQAPEWVEEAEVVEDSVEAAERDAVARAFADKAEAAAVAEIMARAAQAKAEATKTPAEDEDIFAEDEGYFDETVLRDLVRDLIREELSGTLGERITRNVRKLVRAEINRALTARDFE